MSALSLLKYPAFSKDPYMHVPGWAYEKNGTQSDPTNLIFGHKDEPIPMQEITDRLTSNGWIVDPGFAGIDLAVDLFLHIDDDKIPQDHQVVLSEGALVFGNRYHVRLWHFDGIVIGSAHREVLRLLPLPPRHEVISFESGEKLVCSYFDVPGMYRVEEDSHDMENELSQPAFCNGYASVILRDLGGDQSG